MRRGHRGHPQPRPGLAALELAISLPLVILPLPIGVWELGRMVEVPRGLTVASRERGRQTSTGILADAQVIPVVAQCLQRAGQPTAHAVVSGRNLTAGGVDCTPASQLDRPEVTVRLPYANVRRMDLGLAAGGSTLLTGPCVWMACRDQVDPGPPVEPID